MRVPGYGTLLVKNIEMMCLAVDMLLLDVDWEVRRLKQAQGRDPEQGGLLGYTGALDVICANADLLLMGLDRLEGAIEQLLAGYPGVVTSLLRYLELMDNNVVRIKSNVLRLKLALQEKGLRFD